MRFLLSWHQLKEDCCFEAQHTTAHFESVSNHFIDCFLNYTYGFLSQIGIVPVIIMIPYFTKNELFAAGDETFYFNSTPTPPSQSTAMWNFVSRGCMRPAGS